MSDNEKKQPAKPSRRDTKSDLSKAVKAVKDLVTGDTTLPDESGDTTSSAGAYRRADGVAEFYGFTRGNTVFSFDAEGQVISRKLVWPQEPVLGVVDGKQFSLPLEVEGLRAPPRLPLGITGIWADTRGGKSTMIRELAKVMNLQRVIAVEPHDDGAEVANVPTFSTADGALAAALGQMYRDKSVLFAIDSLRAPLFETTGAAGSKGVIMPFFTQLTRVSNQLAMAGMSVIVTVNPMNDDTEYLRLFASLLSSSLPCTITIDSVSDHKSENKIFRGSISMRPDRVPRAFTFGAATPKAKRFAEDHVLDEIVFEPVGTTNLSSYMANPEVSTAFNKAI